VGAVAAATSDLVALGNAAVGNPADARRLADTIATGALAQRLKSGLPALVAAIHARVRDTRAPLTLVGWPLGYRLLTFDGSTATVALWHLDVAASSALQLMTVDYATSMYRLRFLSGTWRIDRVSTASGPTPPPASAPAWQLDAFARSAGTFSRYRYVP
jgi:hypothetical protein